MKSKSEFDAYQIDNATSALYKTHFCMPNLEMFMVDLHFSILHTLHCTMYAVHHTLKLYLNDPPTYSILR